MKTSRPPFFFILTFFAVTASAQPTIYIVRHAEKLATWMEDDALDPFHPLSAEGVARAQKLTEQFQSEAIAAIFSSRTTRALHTALPLSQKLNLPVEVVEACMDTAAIASFYKNLAQRFGSDKSVVLVSHSNIIPYLLLKAGLPRTCFKEMRIKAAAPNEWLLIEGYDNIWQVKNLSSPQKSCNDFLRKTF
jgi:broad specificity phosphatase PhoE